MAVFVSHNHPYRSSHSWQMPHYITAAYVGMVVCYKCSHLYCGSLLSSHECHPLFTSNVHLIVLFLTICSCIFLYFSLAILALMKAATLLLKRQHL